MADMNKFGFRIKTRGGMVVENLMVQARDQAEVAVPREWWKLSTFLR